MPVIHKSEIFMKYVTGTLAVLFFIITLIFAIQNLELVDVSLLTWSMKIRKVFLILGTYVLGMLTGWGAVELIKRSIN
jgi:putative membrane protein